MKQQVIFFWLCFFCSYNIVNAQTYYEHAGKPKLHSEYLFPEKKKDGYYIFDVDDGFILTSYRDSLPEGAWTYYSKDSVIISISFFSKGEILHKQYYDNGKLKWSETYEYSSVPTSVDSIKSDFFFNCNSKLEDGIGLYGEKCQSDECDYYDNGKKQRMLSIGVWGPKSLISKDYKEGKLISIFINNE